MIGVNPAGDSPARCYELLSLIEDVRQRLAIPTQSCVLTHVSTTIGLATRRAPVDLVFQSIGGTQATNRSFGVELAMLREGQDAALALKRGTVGNNVMYFETGQGSSYQPAQTMAAINRRWKREPMAWRERSTRC